MAKLLAGSSTVALTTFSAPILRRSMLKKNEAFLLIGPPMFPLYCWEL